MHEYSIVGALLEQVEDQAAPYGDPEVQCIYVRVGELAGVDTALLHTAWTLIREGTRCAGADLRLEQESARWQCPKCAEAIAPGRALRCPQCEVPARLAAGDALVLERIEMEVNHV